ncbi:SspB family protein [Ancylobacter sp. TS-1]|uniref:SspB family protein n=1 Tax=Ancylobacter sp. TS-1 TaxID=1850374 RepID=UPI001265D158|nr:ClpXP protease specificity-enhancing factor SspB [Ancylobacter sp. TS-1]QFR33329.1 hypothetical protein GBB76_09380 [Ancylobacter sp. TS-1]
MSVDLIRYDLLVQDALRGVVRRVLTDVARDGLPGDHHLYVSFDTCAAGVRLSPRLKERYPEEMTIVLQHQFWDLVVTEPFFEVGLSFNGIPERLHVPFSALKGFFDPSVKFGLQFEPVAEEDEAAEPASLSDTPPAPAPTPSPVTMLGEARPTSVPSTRAPARPAEPATAATREPKPAPATAPRAARPAPAGEGKPSPKEAASKDTAPKDAAAKDAGGKDNAGKDDGAKDGGAQVVRLDAFRKK